MKVRFTTNTGRMTFEFDSQSPKQAFEQVAACGQCDSANIRWDKREYDGNAYYKLTCVDCGAQLDFGQHKSGITLFVKRKDKDNNPIGKNGWYHWQGRDRHDTL